MSRFTIDRGLVGRVANLVGVLDGASQGINGLSGRGEELIGVVKLAFLQRGDSLGRPSSGHLGKVLPALSPGPPGKGAKCEQGDAREDQERTAAESAGCLRLCHTACPGPGFHQRDPSPRPRIERRRLPSAGGLRPARGRSRPRGWFCRRCRRGRRCRYF